MNAGRHHIKVIGEGSELTERLVEAVNTNDWPELSWFPSQRHTKCSGLPVNTNDWPELSWFLVSAVEDDYVRVALDPGRDYLPGSVDTERRSTNQTVSRYEYLSLIRNRRFESIGFGIRKNMLVHELSDEITSHLRPLHNTDQGNERRIRMKTNLKA